LTFKQQAPEPSASVDAVGVFWGPPDVFFADPFPSSLQGTKSGQIVKIAGARAKSTAGFGGLTECCSETFS